MLARVEERGYVLHGPSHFIFGRRLTAVVPLLLPVVVVLATRDLAPPVLSASLCQCMQQERG